jgi:SAM-dependent methyltransferase
LEAVLVSWVLQKSEEKVTNTASNPALIAHLIQGNQLSGERVADHLLRTGAAGHVADLGVGAGNTISAVVQACRARGAEIAKITGIEISPDLLQHAASRLASSYGGACDLRVCDMYGFMAQAAGMEFDAALISYSLHHLSHHAYLLGAIEKGEVAWRQDGWWYVPSGQSCAPPIAQPIPYFPATLESFARSDTSPAQVQEALHQLQRGARGITLPLRDLQLEFLVNLRGNMRPGGVVCLFDPERGISKGFNLFHLERAFSGAADAIFSGIEIGFASFSSLAESAARLRRAGFEVERAILQVRLEGETPGAPGPVMAVEQDPAQPGYGCQLGEGAGRVSDILGHGIIAVLPT